MATYISPEQRAKILSAIKNEGMSIPDASKTFMITEETIKKWIRKQTKNAHTSSTELAKLRQENIELKAIIGEMVLNQRNKKKNTFLGSWVCGRNSIEKYSGPEFRCLSFLIILRPQTTQERWVSKDCDNCGPQWASRLRL